MKHLGIMKNGVIVPDEPGTIPDGTCVHFELAEGDDYPADAMPPTETYEEHLEILRHSIAEMKAGVRGMPIEEFAAQLKREFGEPEHTTE